MRDPVWKHDDMDLGGQTYAGTCAFRLMPLDPLAEGPSSAVITEVGGGTSVHYSWTHPTDGPQQGVLLIGGAGEAGAAEAVLFDTWHQQPGLMSLTGERSQSRIAVEGTYAEEWGWRIELVLEPGRAAMTMSNVVPESALALAPPEGPSMSAGPYEVMVASWTADESR